MMKELAGTNEELSIKLI